MNKYVSRLGLIAAIGAMAAGTAWAGTLEISLQSGSSSTGDITVISGTGYSSTNFNGWSISYTPTSYSPSTDPVGLNLNGFETACSLSSGCAPLTLSLSGTGFTSTVPMSGFNTSLAYTNDETQGVITGSITQSAYYDSSNSLFGENGTIGTFTLNSGGYAFTSGGGPASGTYSLTLVDTFSTSCNTSNCAKFGIDATIGDTSVPEPGTLALFAAGLLGCGLVIARRRRARARQS